MGKRQATNQIKDSRPKFERADPHGNDAVANTTVGNLRKILWVVIFTSFAGSCVQFCKQTGLENELAFVRNHSAWYLNHQT